MSLRRGASSYRGDRELSAGEMYQRIRELREKGTGKFDQRRIAAYLVEIHKKFSIPVACLVFVLLGTPLGVMAQKGGIGVAGAISLFFFTVYWALLVNGEDLARRQLIPPAMAMWTPNIILALVGFWLIGLAKRRTSLPAVGWIASAVSRLLRLDRTTKPDGSDHEGSNH